MAIPTVKAQNIKLNLPKLLTWGKVVVISGSAQLFVQLLGFISGIIVIRLLSTQEYALYTLANTMLGTLTLLADGGISAGVMAQGGPHWQSREKLGIILSSGLHLRNKFALGSLLISIPAIAYLLALHGASWYMCAFIIISIIPAFYAALSDNILEIGFKLHQDIVPLQKNLVAANIGRLIMIALTLFIFPFTFIAILSNGIPRLLANIRLKRISVKYADPAQKPDIIIQKQILSTVRKILPGAIYYCVSGQITIWIISIFGSTSSVAQVGALGRLAMLIGIFSVIFNTVAVPRFSRLKNDKKDILKKYILIQVVLLTLGSILILLSLSFSTQILWLLGSNYSNLKNEMILSIAGSCLGSIITCSFAVNVSRAWALTPLVSIPVSIGAIICGVLLIDVSTIKGILMLNIFVSAIEVVMYVGYGFIKISGLTNNHIVNEASALN